MGEQTVKKHKFKKWRKPGIRMQVMLGFVLFTAVIVTLLWTFQITLLNTFYKAIKVNEVRSVANRVVAMLDESASASDYFEVTRSTNISILISNSDGSNVSFSPAARGGVLERFDYLDCKQRDGRQHHRPDEHHRTAGPHDHLRADGHAFERERVSCAAVLRRNPG